MLSRFHTKTAEDTKKKNKCFQLAILRDFVAKIDKL